MSDSTGQRSKFVLYHLEKYRLYIYWLSFWKYKFDKDPILCIMLTQYMRFLLYGVKLKESFLKTKDPCTDQIAMLSNNIYSNGQ